MIDYFCYYTVLIWLYSNIPEFLFKRTKLKDKNDKNLKIMYKSYFICTIHSLLISYRIINYIYNQKINIINYIWLYSLANYIYDLFYMIKVKNKLYIFHHLLTIYLIGVNVVFNIINIHILLGYLYLEISIPLNNIGWLINKHNKNIATYTFIPSNIIYLICRGILYPYQYVKIYNNNTLPSIHANICIIILSIVLLLSFMWCYKIFFYTIKSIKKIYYLKN